MAASKTILNYALFSSLDYDKPKILFEDDKLEVQCFPLKHSIDCCGFLVKEKQLPRRMIKDQIKVHQIPIDLIPHIKTVLIMKNQMDSLFLTKS